MSPQMRAGAARNLNDAPTTLGARKQIVEGYIAEQRDRCWWYIFDTLTMEAAPHFEGIAAPPVVGRAGVMIALHSADDECEHGWLPSDPARPEGCTCGLEPAQVVA